MASTSKPKSILPYVTQLLEDEYVQAELRNAAQGLRVVYERTRKQPAKATEDKRVYGNLRRAATSVRNAATALQRPKPQPKKRRLGKIATLAFAVGGCTLLTVKLQKQYAAARDRGTTASPAMRPEPRHPPPCNRPPPHSAPGRTPIRAERLQ